MNSFEYLNELEELKELMEEAVSKASKIYGNVSENEFTENLYNSMNKIEMDIDEVKDEIGL